MLGQTMLVDQSNLWNMCAKIDGRRCPCFRISSSILSQNWRQSMLGQIVVALFLLCIALHLFTAAFAKWRCRLCDGFSVQFKASLPKSIIDYIPCRIWVVMHFLMPSDCALHSLCFLPPSPLWCLLLPCKFHRFPLLSCSLHVRSNRLVCFIATTPFTYLSRSIAPTKSLPTHASTLLPNTIVLSIAWLVVLVFLVLVSLAACRLMTTHS